MRNNYTIILGMALSFTSISCLFLVIGIIIGSRELELSNRVSFPFSRTVGVGGNNPSAPISSMTNEEWTLLQQTAMLVYEFSGEYGIITRAAKRNNCVGEDLVILFAIRKAENGPPGLEFGVLCQAGTDLDTQAGWAAATIMKNRKRWNGEGDFIIFLGNRYCPSDSENWIYNVTYWYNKLKYNET